MWKFFFDDCDCDIWWSVRRYWLFFLFLNRFILIFGGVLFKDVFSWFLYGNFCLVIVFNCWGLVLVNFLKEFILVVIRVCMKLINRFYYL